MFRMIQIFAVLLIISSLSACEWQYKKNQPKSKVSYCQNTNIDQAYLSTIKNEFSSHVAQRIQSNYSDLLDTQTVIDGLNKSTFQLANIQTDTANPASNTNKQQIIEVCTAQLHIVINPQVYTVAQNYSPFMYKPNSYNIQINNVANANFINIQNNSLQQTIHFSVSIDNSNKVSLQFNKNEISQLNQLLATVLLPYGVKKTVIVNGKQTPRVQALAKIMYSVEDNSNSHANDDSQDQNDSTVDITQLRTLQDQQAKALNTLNKLWARMDDTVRQSLENEQSDWETNIHTLCNKESTTAPNQIKKALDQTNCMTNQIKQRISYLQGFIIPE